MQVYKHCLLYGANFFSHFVVINVHWRSLLNTKPVNKGEDTVIELTRITSQGTSVDSSQNDELLTIAEVAGYLKLSRRTAWRWCKSGRLPAAKVGHQWRIARSDLENFVSFG